jgi:hypothetical protein
MTIKTCPRCGYFERHCKCHVSNLSDFVPLEPESPKQEKTLVIPVVKPELKIVSSQESPTSIPVKGDRPALVAMKAAANDLVQKMEHARRHMTEHITLAAKYAQDLKGWNEDLTDVVDVINRLSEDKSEQLLP